MDLNRYSKTYTWGKVDFRLELLTPKQDECKFLLTKIVEQAVRDYINLENSTTPIEQQYYQTAIGFLFDDDYRIEYGGQEMSFEDILGALDTDSNVEWYRERVQDRKEREQNKRKYSKKRG